MSPKTAALVRKLKKYHKWPGILVALFALLFALSGIILNHRNLISNVDISRKWMPPGYQYKNWNLAAVRSSLTVGDDSLLIYGNIGVWMATGGLTSFTDWNDGFPEGIDKRKIYSVVKYKQHLVAGTHFGLFVNTLKTNKWLPVSMPEGEERISDLAVKGDTLLILTRDFLYCTTDLFHIEQIKLPPPEGYDHKAGLFITLWELHSGELFGFTGMLFVDLLGSVLIFLSLTGLFHFLFPKWITRLKKQGKSYTRPLSLKKWNLKWHNLIGYTFVVFLLVNTTAGMFLRPPLLIPIASSQIGILPYTHLDTNNPWNDKLRRIIWNPRMERYVVYTSDGFFYADQNLRDDLVPAPNQPPVSIMGCNTFELLDFESYLVGSFSGLFVWYPASGIVMDYFTGKQAETFHGMGRPVGQNMVAGYLNNCNGRNYWIDYNRGIIATDGGASFPKMPDNVLKQAPISLWNAALEVHTGRIFEHLIGPFYLLYVPLMGLSILIVLISGILIWWFSYRKR
jgi:hypothetical protein